MHLDPRPLKPGDLSFQENARLMAHIAELTQGRDLGPKAIADLDEKERRAMPSWRTFNLHPLTGRPAQCSLNTIPQRGQIFGGCVRAAKAVSLDWLSP